MYIINKLLFFSGNDEQSTEMASSWEDEKVTEAATDGFVAIKIDTQRSGIFFCVFFVVFFFKILLSTQGLAISEKIC